MEPAGRYGETLSRWIEFFEGEDGHLSMSRLLCFMSFFPAAYVVMASQSEGTLGWFLGAYGGIYVGGKVGDALKSKTQLTITQEPQP